jgi:hypothetical protein
MCWDSLHYKGLSIGQGEYQKCKKSQHITGGVEAPEEELMVMVGVAPGIGDPRTVASIRDMDSPIILAGAVRAMEGLDTVVGARDLGNARSLA